jgi:isoleucyl-tRNA synthetase
LTENIYQSLKTFIPEDPNAGDVRSVHFLSFPAAKEEYFDEDIERQVKRMQIVIELTRNIRERNNISLKVGSFLSDIALISDRAFRCP